MATVYATPGNNWQISLQKNQIKSIKKLPYFTCLHNNITDKANKECCL
jgi:hypothetical protein